MEDQDLIFMGEEEKYEIRLCAKNFEHPTFLISAIKNAHKVPIRDWP